MNNVASYGLLVLGMILVLFLPPYIMQTPTYPLAVVSGNSMLPTLKPGELVLLRGIPPNHSIPNGTIVAYSPGQTGISALDALFRPVVVHRIVSEFAQNGTIIYTTKGDNNQIVDSPSIPARNIIGTEYMVVPYVGFLVNFITSPSGMVAVMGIIIFMYAGGFSPTEEEGPRNELVKRFARLVEDGKISTEQLAKLEQKIKYLYVDATNAQIKALCEWWDSTDRNKVMISMTRCQECDKVAVKFETKKNEIHIFCLNGAGLIQLPKTAQPVPTSAVPVSATRFVPMNDFVSGMPQGAVVVISGAPGSGADIFVRQALYLSAKSGGNVTFMVISKPPEQQVAQMASLGMKMGSLPASSWGFIDAYGVKRREQGTKILEKALGALTKSAEAGNSTCIDSIYEVAKDLTDDALVDFLDELGEASKTGRGIHFLYLGAGLLEQQKKALIVNNCSGYLFFEIDQDSAEPIGTVKVVHMETMEHNPRTVRYRITRNGIEIDAVSAGEWMTTTIQKQLATGQGR